jgi:activator of HSP90 ATPase
MEKFFSPIEKQYFYFKIANMDKFKLSVTLPAGPQEIYDAWLSGKEHSKFTGSKATASARKKGSFTAWDGYISGKNLELKKGKRIVQSWRTTEFPNNAEDSILELRLEKKEGSKTALTLIHTNIPKGQGARYKGGWKTHYFEPMKDYFARK